MPQKDRLLGLKENVIIGKLIPAGTGMPSRREQLDWMPKPKALAGLFGDEELAAPPPEEEISLEDLDDDEDEDEVEEGADVVAEEGPKEAELKAKE